MNTTASMFDELEKIALNAGSRGGKVHHYTAKNKPVYQSEVDRKSKDKQSKGWTAGNITKGVLGTAGAIALGLAARKFLGNPSAKRVAERVAKNHGTWAEAKKAYKSVYNVGAFGANGADHAAGHAAFEKHFEDARKAHDSAHHASNWKKWSATDTVRAAYDAAKKANVHADSVRGTARKARQAADSYENTKANPFEGFRDRWKSEWGANPFDDLFNKQRRGTSTNYSSGARSKNYDPGARTKNYSVGHVTKLEEAGLPGLGKVKTKAEAKNIYRDFVTKHHPDKTQGTMPAQEQAKMTEKLKTINSLWDSYKNSDEFSKLAAIRYAFMTFRK
ncbi:hypothetical protein UFOVP276_50 [uncultured Caudovirales phage]|uniref:J domain-containing protein n=1 Tax=uncultured Caudovirales phage TaxID=2100421 RepID=A0A6J5LPJ9_9CAUD|nr:hypothetical protein UFOVP127_187 [uncultured Caudovirales phage]CAB4135030.1 hypothetical protein UFOVP276_50 [uncultured Caudovirales phage]